MRTAQWLGIALAAAAIGCGDDGGGGFDGGWIVLFDASPDAYVCPGMVCGSTCIDTTSDPFHCGACDDPCSPSAVCEDSACACPPDFLPAAVDDPDATVGRFGGSMTVFARSTVIGTDGLEHRVIIGWDPATVQLDTELDLATTESAFVRIRYNTGGDPSGSFGPTAGTIRLTRACDEGVTGTIAGLTLAETEGGPGGSTVIPDGCGYDVGSVTFDLGPACGTSADAGVPDAGVPDGG